MAKDILLEIGTEELPAPAVRQLFTALKENAASQLAALGLSYKAVRAMGTPRRLALIVEDVAEKQADKTEEKRGPSIAAAFSADGNPTKAALGFAKGAKISPDQLVQRDGYVYATIHTAGQETKEILKDFFPALIKSLPLPNAMRWGDLDFKFLRPIRWLVALYGQDIVPFELAGLKAGRISRGHRVLSNGEGEPFDPAGKAFSLSTPKAYEAECEKMYVIACPDRRQAMIRDGINKAAAKCLDENGKAGQAQIEEGLLEEVTFLVEWPTALAGRIDEKYMALPPEAIVTPMRDHQRYFPVVDDAGKLLPYFITVRSGGERALDTVAHGNERVLRARLADAEFFFKEDREKPLADYLEKLKTLNFQTGLGTVYDKALRLEKLAAVIAANWGVTEKEKSAAIRAALLAKADLVTSMVVEFTELQGVIGRSYALLDGEENEVATAIEEHYRPRFAGGVLPQTTAGAIVSLADKIDTIVGCFSLGLIPTGSEDPFALRRQALGMLLTVIRAADNLKSLNLTDIAKKSAELYGLSEETTAKVIAALEDFLRLRLEKILSDENIRYDIAAATINPANAKATLLLAKALTKAIERRPAETAKIAAALGRAANLAVKAPDMEAIPNLDLYETQEEENLHYTYEGVAEEVAAAIAQGDYTLAIEALSPLAPAIDDFFDAVMVMVDDEAIKNNRLALLASITRLSRRLADWGKIEV